MNQYGPLKRNTEMKKYYLMSILMLFSWFALAAENATTEIIVYKTRTADVAQNGLNIYVKTTFQ